MSKTIIYKDTDELSAIKTNITRYCDILNNNMKSVLAINDKLSYKVTFLHTFVTRQGTNRAKILGQIKEVLNVILTKENPFNSPEFVNSFANEINAKLHDNKTFLPNGDWDIRDGESGNIKTIGDKQIHFCRKFITWNGNEFVANEKAVSDIEERLTYYTHNKKQEKTMEQLNIIDAAIKQLNIIGFDDYVIYGGEDGFPFARYYGEIARL